MINNKSVIAVIPARGGSKGLPGKNIRPLCGKPLIAWSIEQALGSTYVDKVLVTTDSIEIAEISKLHGADVPFLRPAELATDTATSFDTIVHALDFCEKTLNCEFTYTILLEPTAPLREWSDIDLMTEKLDQLQDLFDGVISVGEMTQHPSFSKACDGDHVLSFYSDIEQNKRRQDLDNLFWPFGGAFVIKTEVLHRDKTFYPTRLTHHKIKRYQCYEIDDLYDFLCVEAVMKHEWRIK